VWVPVTAEHTYATQIGEFIVGYYKQDGKFQMGNYDANGEWFDYNVFFTNSLNAEIAAVGYKGADERHHFLTADKLREYHPCWFLDHAGVKKIISVTNEPNALYYYDSTSNGAVTKFPVTCTEGDDTTTHDETNSYNGPSATYITGVVYWTCKFTDQFTHIHNLPPNDPTEEHGYFDNAGNWVAAVLGYMNLAVDPPVWVALTVPYVELVGFHIDHSGVFEEMDVGFFEGPQDPENFRSLRC